MSIVQQGPGLHQLLDFVSEVQAAFAVKRSDFNHTAFLGMKMVLSNGPSDEAHERTALLSGNKPSHPSLSDTIKPSGNGNVNGTASKSGVEDGGDVDEEAGDATVDGDAREENPLFEGNEEMRKKMYILCPAVAIGVSFLILFPY